MEEFKPHLTKSQTRRLRHTLLIEKFFRVFLIAFVVLLFFSAYTGYVWVGELLILLFGVVCLIGKVESTVTFKLALGFVIAIPISLLVAPYSQIPEMFAVFVFLLLLLGTLQTLIELKYAKLSTGIRKK
jgi:pheromone shutdown protein TraB